MNINLLAQSLQKNEITILNSFGRNNIISNVEYTPCLKKNYLIENCPGWKLKANKAYHNLDTKTVHYDHARIHLFNIPVFYLPYFSHPDPSVNRQSGLLQPHLNDSDILGSSLQIPYFYVVSEDKDFTFTNKFSVHIYF